MPLCGGEKDGDSDLACLVDHVIRDARAGEGDEAFRQEVEQDVVTPEGRGLAVPVPVRLADDLVNAVLLGPACRDLLRAGAAAVQQDHVIVLDLDTVQRAPDGGDVGKVLAAGEGDQGAFGQMRGGLAVFTGAQIVAGVDLTPR